MLRMFEVIRLTNQTFIVQTHKISVAPNPTKSSSKNGRKRSYGRVREKIMMIETYVIPNAFKNLTIQV